MILRMNEKISINPILLKGSCILLQPISIEGLSDFHEYSMCKEFYNHFEFPEFNNISESEVLLICLLLRLSNSFFNSTALTRFPL